MTITEKDIDLIYSITTHLPPTRGFHIWGPEKVEEAKELMLLGLRAKEELANKELQEVYKKARQKLLDKHEREWDE